VRDPRAVASRFRSDACIRPTKSWLVVSGSRSLATAESATAPLRMEQCVEVGGGPSQLVQSDTVRVAEIDAWPPIGTVSGAGFNQ
jgi:hypothetical protein